MKETAERLMDLAEAHIRNAGYAGFSRPISGRRVLVIVVGPCGARAAGMERAGFAS